MNVDSSRLTQLWATKTKDDEWWSSFVTSPLAVALNYFVVDIEWLTPNRITLLSFITAIISVIFILVGGTASFIIAALLIHLSHVLDCMDGQMARYRKTTSAVGGFYDKLTDQIQVMLWFGAVGYAAYAESSDILPVFLAFSGVAFYSLRGYAKYAEFHSQITQDSDFLSQANSASPQENVAGLGFSAADNFRWFVAEQRKFLLFNEGVFIFMLSFALVFDALTPMLWVFSISQIYYGLSRGWQRSENIKNNQKIVIEK